MKICILGGSGLIGSSLLSHFGKLHDVITTYHENQVLGNFNAIKISGINDLKKLENFFEEEKPNWVINTIALSNADYCETHKDQALEINYEFPLKIANICHLNNSRLIHFSSDYVFDGKKGNYKENDKMNPINYYGYTKEKSEKVVLEYKNNIVIRTSLVYGLHANTRFFNYVLDKISRNEPVYAYNDTHSSPTLLNELVETTGKMILSDASGIFHVAGSSCVTRYDFAKTMAEKFGQGIEKVIPITSDNTKSKVKKPNNSCLNNTKASETFDIKYSSYKEGIETISKKIKQYYS